MQAMVLNEIGASLEWTELDERHPGPGKIRVKVAACGVCRTDLPVVDGELPNSVLPIIPGREIVGHVDDVTNRVESLSVGQRVGISWLGHTCGVCTQCVTHRQNLCDRLQSTGHTRNGSLASHTIAEARFAVPLGEAGSAAAMAPLL